MTPRRQAPRSRSPFYAAIVVIALGGAAVLAYSMTKAPEPVALDPNAPPVAAQGYTMGSDSAPVEVIEFGDFECPQCAVFATLQEPDVRTRLVNTGVVRFRYFDFPITQRHPNSLPAHNAAACADDQGKFWEMHDRLFQAQPEWEGLSTRNPRPVFERLAKEIGLDMDKFETCYETRPHEARILANQQEGIRLGVTGTPNFIIDGKLYPTILAYDEIKAIADSVVARKAQRTSPAPGGSGGKQ